MFSPNITTRCLIGVAVANESAALASAETEDGATAPVVAACAGSAEAAAIISAVAQRRDCRNIIK
jgi:hypothetical protein